MILNVSVLELPYYAQWGRNKMAVLNTFITLILVASVNAIQTKYFKFTCNQTIPIPDEGDILFVIDKYHPLSKSPCTVFVFNQRSASRVLVNLNKFKIDGSKNCTQSRLNIYDGHGSNKPLTGKNGLCGSIKRDLYNSTQQNMTFTVHDNKGTASITLLVTSARKGDCHHNELNCQNGFCIPGKLACNGYNNCGNGIDELTCVLSLAVGVIIAIVIGALLGIACLTTVIICVVCRPHHRRRYRQI
ncbi:low-density lipoprotein receptor-related protein 3-like [Mytilus edulis]|uniref:low-density lipoprotein receptor-related protein 3-like n=1 Tax=Mytilus edulis TaxID=6550 RepID=UPI0039EE5066